MCRMREGRDNPVSVQQNLTSAEYVAQKGFAEDLDEGKYSLPLIHTLQSLPRHETIVLRNLLTQRRVAGHSPLFFFFFFFLIIYIALSIASINTIMLMQPVGL
jgi:hypothetical protein